MMYIIQNDPEVPPGNLTADLMIPYKIVHPYGGEYLPSTDDIDSLIVLGGRMGANDDFKYPFLRDLKVLINKVVEREIPYLGICLGGQLLASAMGAKVVSKRWEEIGTVNVTLTADGKSDQLFQGFPVEFDAFQWHHDSFDIPIQGKLLAFSAHCSHQAFRIGRCAWGVQFHPEVTRQIIVDWCAWESSDDAEVTDDLPSLFSRKESFHRNTARLLMHNFISASRYPSIL